MASDLYFLLKGIIEVFVEEVGSKFPDKSSEIRYSDNSKPKMKGIKVRTHVPFSELGDLHPIFKHPLPPCAPQLSKKIGGEVGRRKNKIIKDGE